jgi:hypothetical protein
MVAIGWLPQLAQRALKEMLNNWQILLLRIEFSKDTVRKYHKIIDKPGLKGNLTEVIEHDITIS